MYDPTALQLQHDQYEVSTYTEITLAPGEGQVPLSIFRDEDAESYLFEQISVDKGDLAILMWY